METIQIRMLGEFSLTAGENRISDAGNRSRKVWMLLAYLVCNRGRTVSQKKLIELLWGDDPASTNPENALRITFHRARTLLNQLWPKAGHELIVSRDSGYAWNDQASTWVDSEEFDRLCSQRTEDPEEKLRNLLQALELYRGDFLEKQSSEVWVIPISTHFHNLYLQASMEAAGLLSAREQHAEAAALCRSAVSAEPYHEPLHQLLMRGLSAAGDQKGAAAVYEALAQRLFDDFGIRPSEETRAVYRTCVHSPSEQALPIDEIMEHLQEQNTEPGAMLCDYDYFKVLCYAEARSMPRRGNATHILLLSVTGTGDEPLSKRTQSRIMGQLGDQIRTNLRRGDVFSRCSVSQYIIMLPQANYENSCMVSRRLIAAFHRSHPHVAVKFNFMVQPLTPNICVP